jgi:hypothetical protein
MQRHVDVGRKHGDQQRDQPPRRHPQADTDYLAEANFPYNLMLSNSQ